MIELPIWMVVTLALLVIVITALVVYLWQQQAINQQRELIIQLQSAVETARHEIETSKQLLHDAQGQFGSLFKSMADDALKQNNNEFLKLAQEKLKQHQITAVGELKQREQAVENLIKPIKEVMERTDRQIRDMERERQNAYGSLTKHLEQIAESHKNLQAETRNLVQALRRPEVRGQWGEMSLKRLAELAGMVEHCDFIEQTHVRDDEGKAFRPDMIIRMPDEREIIVDAKTPLDAYLSAIETDDQNQQQHFLDRHVKNVRTRVKELASKAYWNQFPKSPDFVVLFIPGEQFLSSALDRDHKLLEDALASRVILATPTSFIALLRAVGYGWRQQVLADNAEKIREVGEELYGRLGAFADHLTRLGKSLDSSVGHFNKAVGSFESRVVPSARKFTEMGVQEKKKVESVPPIEKLSRPPQEES